jgi:hypothetical protein
LNHRLVAAPQFRNKWNGTNISGACLEYVYVGSTPASVLATVSEITRPFTVF